ncbi:hormogonium tapered terminus morphoprotein TftA [Gloeothece verrucosa]|uniref:Mannosyl-glycoprotein endo-beta-N-acetylglucosamidase-like domain-containing protein n=1 Tax=Gloeothece verrucosa (strain PCC 7822) TaxID=497965 RepID=E0U5G8_GLOV7|nr:glucosaminidase domain-containing protein [Gloeothece verrucosa]ADN13558.1 conserved hypothetical protein [Gloeothece verrucosa PCC 7822]
MGNIFVWINYLDNLKNLQQGKTAVIEQMILLRNHLVFELRSQGCRSFVVPEDLNLSCAIQWINDRADSGDIALAISVNHSNNSSRRGIYITYIANNLERKKHAEVLLLLLLHRLPHLSSLGSQPDTMTLMGQLPFCRQVIIPSLQITLGYLSNPDDKNIIFNEHPKLVQGLVDGLMAWSREVTGIEPNQEIKPLNLSLNYSSLEIRLNSRIYPERGIVVYGNPCIPIDLVDRLGLDLTDSSNLIEAGGIVYLKAVDLEAFNISIEWENLSQTLILRTILPFDNHQIKQIMGQGRTSEVQMMMFLKVNNEKALKEFPQIAKFYREEGAIEGVNSDIAFCQMCLETDFLRFGREQEARNYNFAHLGRVESKEIAVFSDVRLGVRCHIQHLKAYASLEPLVQEVVDPRFYLVARGVAPSVSELSGRWSADLSYSKKILAILKRLYESINLF